MFVIVIMKLKYVNNSTSILLRIDLLHYNRYLWTQYLVSSVEF